MKSSDRFAIAFDLGTTTIAATLLDRERGGERLAVTGALNPQRELGADVVARLSAALRSPEDHRRLAFLVNRELERLARELLAMAGITLGDLAVIAVAGNPTMEHLMLGLPVKSLAFPPYRPQFTAGKRLHTRELGWEMDVAAYLFPLPGGFVGGDLVAFLYGVDVTAPRSPHAHVGSERSGPRLFLDLGTNGEMALAAGEAIHATSAAAGPAFEGGNLACGMAALPGAISGVALQGDRLDLATIGNVPPVGVCGSGVLDAVSLLLGTGVLDPTGRLREPAEIPSNLANRVREVNGEKRFVLYQDASRQVFIGQEDIRQVQLAKGAVRAGMEILLGRSGLPHEALREVVLTGSFGAELRAASLKNVGIFTEKMVEIVSFVREGALAGVERALRLPGGLAAVEELAASVRVVPLSGTPAFEKHFLEQMNFPRPEPL